MKKFTVKLIGSLALMEFTCSEMSVSGLEDFLEFLDGQKRLGLVRISSIEYILIDTIK